MRGMDLGGSVISGGAGAQSELKPPAGSRAHPGGQRRFRRRRRRRRRRRAPADGPDGVRGCAPRRRHPRRHRRRRPEQAVPEERPDRPRGLQRRRRRRRAARGGCRSRYDGAIRRAEGAEGAEAVASDVHRATPAADPTESAEAAKDRGNALFKSGDFKSADCVPPGPSRSTLVRRVPRQPRGCTIEAARSRQRPRGRHRRARVGRAHTGGTARDGVGQARSIRRKPPRKYDFVERRAPARGGSRRGKGGEGRGGGRREFRARRPRRRNARRPRRWPRRWRRRRA